MRCLMTTKLMMGFFIVYVSIVMNLLRLKLQHVVRDPDIPVVVLGAHSIISLSLYAAGSFCAFSGLI